MGDGEHMVTDPRTGGVKGRKLARMELLPGDALHALAEHFGRGAEKYADRNWERGYDWSLSYGALQRHAWAWWQGEGVDPETGSSHAVAMAWHALALVAFELRAAGTDDRPKPKKRRKSRAKGAPLRETVRAMVGLASAAYVMSHMTAKGEAVVLDADGHEVSDPVTEHLRATGQVGEPDPHVCGYPDCGCRRPQNGCEGEL